MKIARIVGNLRMNLTANPTRVYEETGDTLEVTIERGEEDITLYDADGHRLAIFVGHKRVTLTSQPGCPDPAAHDPPTH